MDRCSRQGQHQKEASAKTCNVFFSGSVAKMYTVTAAMILYEQGKLDLDAKINQFYNEVVNKLPNAKRATIRQLMNHSAGMPDHDDEAELSDWSDRHDGSLPSAIEQLSYLYDNSPRFAPGDTAMYSSAHTLTLSLVLDHIVGEHHSHLISREIISHLGLSETFYKNEAGYPQPVNLVRAYYGQKEDITKEAINYASGSQGDAGIIASAYDYYQFIEALMTLKIISQSTLDEMLRAKGTIRGSYEGKGFGIGFV